MAKLICIVCPKGCHLTVDETTFEVVGNNCPRGAAYGKAELTSPTRVITSTVKVEKGDICRCPVRTKGAIPKGKMFDVMSALRKVTLVSPVKIGDVVIPNVCDTGIDVIATRNV
ncbi:MAG: DUF1667 domain-containing protein [Clostridia bacterium]|nr:DUF1667 domain-containing protein [Clostridia bacterium]